MQKTIITQISIVVVVLATSIGLVFAQNIRLDDLENRNGIYYKRDSNVPFTGEVRVGTRGGEGMIQDGRRDGTWTKYFPNGALLQKQTYKDGFLDGPWLTFYVTGQLRSEKTYKGGKLEGPWLNYSVKGELVSVINYKDGIEVD